MAGPPYPIPNLTAPIAQCPVDPVTGAVTVGGVATYTQISTSGTTTVKPSPGVLFGFSVNAAGTTATVAAYDINGTNTATLVPPITLSSAGQTIVSAGVGVRFLGSLVVVTTGTGENLLTLWD